MSLILNAKGGGADLETENRSFSPEQMMETLQLAAQMIMESGGETFRAEETVCRMGKGFGLQQVESFAVPSGLFISFRTAEGRLETSVKRAHPGQTDLTKVDQVNQISRLAAAGRLAPEEALRRLKALDAVRKTPAGWGALGAAAVCAAGFCLLFQGGWRETLMASGLAVLVQGIRLFSVRIHGHGIFSNILGGLLTAFLPALAAGWIPGLMTETVVAGALMPLVPGVAMANAVQDGLRGDTFSGLSHGAQALMTACLIAGGALLSPALLRLLKGGGL